jgi:hypothetical protein
LFVDYDDERFYECEVGVVGSGFFYVVHRQYAVLLDVVSTLVGFRLLLDDVIDGIFHRGIDVMVYTPS